MPETACPHCKAPFGLAHGQYGTFRCLKCGNHIVVPGPAGELPASEPTSPFAWLKSRSVIVGVIAAILLSCGGWFWWSHMPYTHAQFNQRILGMDATAVRFTLGCPTRSCGPCRPSTTATRGTGPTTPAP